MTSSSDLLQRFQPVLKYDSQETYFADSAQEWTDNPGNVLLGAGGQALATAGSGLSLDLLGTMTEAKTATVNDVLSDPNPSEDYVTQAATLHADPVYANQIYGRAVLEGQTLWLQYWFYYFYNDYNLIGDVIGAGLHECDWEMIQLRLPGGLEVPDLAVYAQHAHAQSRDWRQVDLAPGTTRPIVYPARGSHASYFEPGMHWTGYWFDHADGKRRSPDQQLHVVQDGDAQWEWLRWPGYWGDTKKGDLPIDSDSPRGPGRHGQWDVPSSLLDTAPRPAATQPLSPLTAPSVRAEWDGEAIRVLYSVAPSSQGTMPTALVITVNSPDETGPPATRSYPIDSAAGAVELTGVQRAHAYDLFVSCVVPGDPPQASASVRADLAAAM